MNKTAESAMHWMIAGVVAAFIAWIFVRAHAVSNTPCLEQRCIAELDSRLAAIEAEMRTRTVDRYTGSDAKRDMSLVNQRIDALHARIEAAHK